ncbi:FAD-dependent monooxygenase [Aliiruegeria lutimaris]|uniref:Salicylate hydroxylase n=1 Tax=Aliiruegeria lutimaris TaxID=571298 RepID=A0A1G8KUM8_9RHOB|nr:FAD-dependent monooxygenase [Aliiruegeria lutimaris]SDI47093.1 salicylate hydroxylase [Aliiruegeria lutimaris]
MLIGQEITILGAGIAGLGLARALAMRGASVRILEQAPAIAEVGAGIQISPNAGRVLDAMGLGEAFEKISVPSSGAALRDYARGTEVLRLDLTRFGRFGLVHRADLIEILLDATRELGVEIELGARVGNVSLDGNRAVLDIGDLGLREVPFVVAADGLRSCVRRALLGAETPLFTGHVAWRALLPIEPGEVPNEAHVFMGPGRHLVAYPLRGGTVLNIVGVHERGEWTEDGWNHPGDPDQFRALFGEFGDPVRGWLQRIEDVIVWGLFKHAVAPRWHGANAALMGDAAHPTLPFLAQGACMALEDAWVLADCLDSSESREAALARYESLRAPRCKRIVDAGTANARNYHLSSAPVRGFAHMGLRVIGKTMPGFMPDRFKWLYSHDVTA